MKEAMVLGAGMVGMATALQLQARGYQVAVVDRKAPGEETSYGNAGLIQSEAVEPYAMPRDVPSLWNTVFRRNNDVHLHWHAMPAYVRPLLAYFAHSAPARYRRICAVYSQLAAQALADHAPLIEAAQARHLIERKGFLQIYRDAPSLELGARQAQRLHHTYGVPIRILDTETLRHTEPHIQQPMAGAIHWTGTWNCSDPGGLVKAYGRLFEQRGGQLLRGDAATLTQTPHGWRVHADHGSISASHAIVALGPWSQPLMARLGYRVPMFRKRGYHRHYAVANGPRIPIMDKHNGMVCTPMRQGLRIATGAELAHFGAAATPVQLARAEAAARELFALGAPLESAPWMGNRPCMTDMLPVAGAAPRHPGLWMHFGHGHQGFTQGPTTARLLAQCMEGEPSPLQQSLRFERFL